MSIVQHPTGTAQVLAFLAAHVIGLGLIIGWGVQRVVLFVRHRRELLGFALECECHARELRAFMDGARHLPAEQMEQGRELVGRFEAHAARYRRDASFF